MSPSWQYVLTPRAEREMQRVDRLTRQRIFAALDRLVEVPGAGDLRKLQGREEEWRLRVGDGRVIFRRDALEHRVVVLRVLPRGRAYRD